MNIDNRFGEISGDNILGITTFAQNTTGGETGMETMSGGSIEAVIRYRESPGEYFNQISVSSQAETISRNSMSPIHFDLSSSPLPVTASDISITLIYYGKVGDSENAICVTSPQEMTSSLIIAMPEEGVYGLTTEKPKIHPKMVFLK